MATTHLRSGSPSPSVEPSSKRLKTESNPPYHEGISSKFTPNLFDTANIARFKDEYKDSTPYKHAVIGQLFDHDLLKSVKDEILGQLGFTEKETDIYKVNQTGDLASLSYLDASQLALLPSLLSLRDALYSTSFRTWLRDVTGCGPLSGSKQDMSVNSYIQTCHLLNHDDVIGTRRVSYILYMPIPEEEPWQPEWGGGLELYPVVTASDGVTLEPTPIPSKTIPPVWNQFIFFEVQPGRSFHSVEEVVVGTEKDGKQRLSISGWFHKAQEGEEGYEAELDEREKSSLEQLSSSSHTSFKEYAEESPFLPLPGTPLTKPHADFLAKFLNPAYLSPQGLTALSKKFAQESSIELRSFLIDSVAIKLEPLLKAKDQKDGTGEKRVKPIPRHTAGVDDTEWTLVGPPHKARYLSLSDTSSLATDPTIESCQTAADILHILRTQLFPSEPFRAWLSLVSSLVPMSHSVEVRRFRPGLDYTLATSEVSEVRLDAVLDLTPSVGGEGEDEGWDSGRWGGWQCYMAPHEGEEDPAVYKSSTPSSGKVKATPSSETENGEEDSDHGEEEDADGPLLTSQPGFNRLLLVLRDEGVLRFVKYVSATAQGSRWDIYGEWQVGAVEEDEDGDDDDDEGEED